MEIKDYLQQNKHFRSNFKSKPFMSNESILKMVMDDDLFGIIWCDIPVPDNLRTKFASFPPIFKHAEVGQEYRSFHEEFLR